MKKIINHLLVLVLLIGVGAGLGVLARQVWPQNPQPNWVRNADEFRAARAKVEKRLSKNPADLDIKIELADLLYDFYNYNERRLEEPDEMYAEIAAELEKNPAENSNKLVKIQLHRGNIAREHKDYSGSIAAFEKGLEFEPDNADLRYNVAYVFMNDLQKYEEANQWFQKIGDKMATDPHFHYNYGRTLYNLGDYTAAKAELEKTMELDPKNAAVVRGDLYKKVTDALEKATPKAENSEDAPAPASE